MLGHRIGHTIPNPPKQPEAFQARATRGAQQVGGHYRRMFQLKTILSDAFGEHDGAIHYVEHHLGHAASAYYASPFESAAILTLDGTVREHDNDGETTEKATRIRVLRRVKLPHSLGQFYSAATNFLGFDMFQGDEYKVMGMAAYGEPEYYDFLRDNVLVANGSGTFNLASATWIITSRNTANIPQKLRVFSGPRGSHDAGDHRASLQRRRERTKGARRDRAAHPHRFEKTYR